MFCFFISRARILEQSSSTEGIGNRGAEGSPIPVLMVRQSDGAALEFVVTSKSTGATVVIGAMGLASGITHGAGIDYAPDGTLWGIADSGQIFTIDTGTGLASVVATTSSGFEGLAIVPEPATLSLLGIGGCLALVRRRRRRRQ